MANWQKEMTDRVGQRVKDLRGDRTAVWLSEQTEKLGMKISRSAISELESGKRRSISVAELLILAAALDEAPMMLLFPGFPDGTVAPLPKYPNSTSRDAIQWASGRGTAFEAVSSQGLILTTTPNPGGIQEAADEREQLMRGFLGKVMFDDQGPGLPPGVEELANDYQRQKWAIQKRLIDLGGEVAGGDDSYHADPDSGSENGSR